MLLTCLLTLMLTAHPVFADDGPRVRFGAAVGLVGEMLVGSDTAQDGAPDDEFGAGLAIQGDILTFDIGAHWQIVPFVRATLLGGPNSDVYETVIGETSTLAGEVSTHLTHVALGSRYLFSSHGFRPFLSLYLGYVVADATYSTQLTGVPPEFADLLPASAESRRHDGMGVTVGVGFRNDFGVDVFGESDIVPIALELQYTKNLWLGLDANTDSYDASLFAPDGMNLDQLSVVLSVGFMR